MIAQADLPEGYRLVVTTLDSLFITDHDDEALQLYAELSEGEIWFSVNCIDKDGLRRTVRGSVLYDLMMSHFGSLVFAVAGFWTVGENRRVFVESLANGKLPGEAAFLTWSGRQACRHGFTVAEFDWKDWQHVPDTIGVRFRREDAA